MHASRWLIAISVYFKAERSKVRGIELRRHDTPDFIKELQQQMLDILAKAPDAEHARDLLPEVQALVRRRLTALKRGRVPLEKLIVRQTLSRELDAYRSPSPTALAARQLAEHDTDLRPGQVVRFVYTLGNRECVLGMYRESWMAEPSTLLVYSTCWKRAAETIFQPFR